VVKLARLAAVVKGVAVVKLARVAIGAKQS
jgi:hypothetical protein